MKKLILYIIIFLFSVPAFAQQDAPLRVELETAKDEGDYHYQTIGTDGVCVFYEGDERGVDTISWIMMAYDTNLKKMANYVMLIPKHSSFVYSAYSDSLIYFLFQENGTEKRKKNEPANLYLLVYDINTHFYQCHTIPKMPDVIVRKCEVIDRHFIFSFFEENTCRVCFYNTLSSHLQDFIIPDAAIVSDEFIEVNAFAKRVYLGLGVLYQKTNYGELALFETDYDGNFISEVAFPSYPDYYYNSARLAVINASTSLVIGTYNNGPKKMSGSKHSGVYTMRYKNSKMDYPEFYSYVDVKNKNGSSSGTMSDNSKIDVQLLVGELFNDSTQYSLVTEVYYPEYEYNRNVYSNSSYYYGSVNDPGTTTFSGYRYVNAYITTFDTLGNISWDYYLPFTNILTYRLINRVSLYYDKEGTVVFYPYSTSLTSTLIQGYDVLENPTTIPIETNSKKDVVEYTRDLKIENWYNNNFIISGYQYIRNGYGGDKSKRYVFFMNKLQYR